MSDRVTDYAVRSLARHIKVAVSGIDNAYVVTPDFDWDKKPSPSNPNQVLDRPLPFAGIILKYENDPPFSMGNILYEYMIDANIMICAKSHTELVNMTNDIRQSLRNAVNTETSNIGIVLYNFAVASGSYYANAGTLQVDLGGTEYFGQDDESEQANKKHHSIVPITLSCFKDSTATLLENKGRINLTDS